MTDIEMELARSDSDDNDNDDVNVSSSLRRPAIDETWWDDSSTQDMDAAAVDRMYKEPSEFQALLDLEDWDELVTTVEQYPHFSRQEIIFICQGERTPCLPLHAAVARRRVPTYAVLECLVTAYPGALCQADRRGGRLPIHMAILKGADLATIQLLHQMQPDAMHVADKEGNLPLHYAAQYRDERITSFILDQYPPAAIAVNVKLQLPLHLLCARSWSNVDNDAMSITLVQALIKHAPLSVRSCDRNGRLPLHLVCKQLHVQSNIVAYLMELYPAGLLMKDSFEQIPLQLLQGLAMHHHHRLSTVSMASSHHSNFNNNNRYNNESTVAALALLQQYTWKEKRKTNRIKMIKLFNLTICPM